mmetsp:Transcript_19267/g.46540  ORF Transcript_19267/g.46540 Transcript_19267/m.46540 type:complete len:205 (+) Transcript_19267:786-1400(+)
MMARSVRTRKSLSFTQTRPPPPSTVPTPLVTTVFGDRTLKKKMSSRSRFGSIRQDLFQHLTTSSAQNFLPSVVMALWRALKSATMATWLMATAVRRPVPWRYLNLFLNLCRSAATETWTQEKNVTTAMSLMEMVAPPAVPSNHTVETETWMLARSATTAMSLMEMVAPPAVPSNHTVETETWMLARSATTETTTTETDAPLPAL